MSEQLMIVLIPGGGGSGQSRLQPPGWTLLDGVRVNDVAWLPRHERWRHGRETDGPLRQIHPSSSCQCFHSLKVLKASQCELSSNALPSSSRSLSPRSNLGPPSVLCLNILSILFTSAFLSLSSLFRHTLSAARPAGRRSVVYSTVICL